MRALAIETERLGRIYKPRKNDTARGEGARRAERRHA